MGCIAVQLYNQPKADWSARCYGNQVKTLIFRVIFHVFERHIFFKVTRAPRLFNADSCECHHLVEHEIFYPIDIITLSLWFKISPWQPSNFALLRGNSCHRDDCDSIAVFDISSASTWISAYYSCFWPPRAHCCQTLPRGEDLIATWLVCLSVCLSGPRYSPNG